MLVILQFSKTISINCSLFSFSQNLIFEGSNIYKKKKLESTYLVAYLVAVPGVL